MGRVAFVVQPARVGGEIGRSDGVECAQDGWHARLHEREIAIERSRERRGHLVQTLGAIALHAEQTGITAQERPRGGVGLRQFLRSINPRPPGVAHGRSIHGHAAIRLSRA